MACAKSIIAGFFDGNSSKSCDTSCRPVKKEYCMLPGLSKEEKHLAQLVATKAGCKLYTDFTPGTSHIICGQNEDGNAK